MKKIVLIGAGGHCKVIIDIIKSNGDYDIVGITDINSKGSVLGVPIVGNDDALEKLYNEGVQYAFISLGALYNMSIRKNIFHRLKEIGFTIPVLIHKDAIVSAYAKIEEGTCIMPRAVINAGAFIAENCIINTGAIIEHDCIIEENTHISPGANLAGAVRVGSGTHIGIGSTVIQGLHIGNKVIIGAGAVVINDIKDNVTAVGIPAKIIKCR